MTKDKNKIVLFLSYLGGGGAERVMLNLGRGFVESGFKVDLVLGKAWGPHLEKIPPQIKVVDLQASGLVATTLALVRYLKKEEPAALLSALHYTNEIAVWAKRLARVSTRIVVSEHNTFSEAIQHTSKTKKVLLPFFVRNFYPWADKVVAVSEGVAKDLALCTGLPSQKIETIYNPVITPELFEKANESINHHWFQPGEPPVIIGVGKLEAQKDFPTLIRTFALVRQVRPARLLILGWGQDKPQLESLIKELEVEDDVSLFGYVDNPYPYMAKASVFALSSAWEGLPTVLIEAMALETPVVSTNCPSGPMEILDNGKHGALTPVGDSKALAQEILNVLSNPAKKIDLAWLDRFTLAQSTQHYLEVLNVK